MYLFTRRGRLVRGLEGVAWAAAIRDHARDVLNTEVALWTTSFSPATGTVSWTTNWADLGSLEESMGRLMRDKRYQELVREGQAFMAGGVEDGLYELLYVSASELSNIHVAGTVTAVIAQRKGGEAVTAGIAIAQKFEAITRGPTAFFVNVTGNYGGVGWISLYEDLAAVETANHKVASDESWLSYLDSLSCFAEDVAATQTTLYSLVP